MMLNVAKALKKAKMLILSPSSWCKKAFARNGEGRRIEVDDKKAEKFYSVGACVRATKGMAFRGEVVRKARDYLDQAAAEVMPKEVAVTLNDYVGTRHSRVIKMFDLAIKLAEEAEDGE